MKDPCFLNARDVFLEVLQLDTETFENRTGVYTDMVGYVRDLACKSGAPCLCCTRCATEALGQFGQCLAGQGMFFVERWCLSPHCSYLFIGLDVIMVPDMVLMCS